MRTNLLSLGERIVRGYETLRELYLEEMFNLTDKVVSGLESSSRRPKSLEEDSLSIFQYLASGKSE